MGALSAIDMALLDITGKYLEVPVYQLLGGKLRDNVRICDTFFFTPHNEIIKKTFKFEDGHMIVPDTPGIGVELSDDTVLAIYPFKRKKKRPIRRSEKTGVTYAGKESEMRKLRVKVKWLITTVAIGATASQPLDATTIQGRFV